MDGSASGESMTVQDLVEAIKSPSGPYWCEDFSESEIEAALRHAKDDHGLTAYVQVPVDYIPHVIGRAAIYLNHLDPDRMAQAVERHKAKKQNDGDDSPTPATA